MKKKYALRVDRSKAKQSQFVSFTAESTEHGEQKNIHATDYIIRKSNFPYSVRELA